MHHVKRHTYYHWRELPQVSFLLRQMFCCNKTLFCCDKSMLVMTKKLCHDKPNYVCCDEAFVVTNIILLRQTFCCGKLTFVGTNICLSQQNKSFVTTKNMLITTKRLSQQTCVSWQIFAMTKVLSGQKYFVTTNIVLLQRAYFCHKKRCVLSWQTHVCCNRTFVTTKMVLVAAPANDNISISANVVPALVW